jgi:hypothetical protein
MKTTIEALKSAVDRNLITADDDVFALLLEQCQKCCLTGGGGNDQNQD